MKQEDAEALGSDCFSALLGDSGLNSVVLNAYQLKKSAFFQATNWSIRLRSRDYNTTWYLNSVQSKTLLPCTDPMRCKLLNWL